MTEKINLIVTCTNGKTCEVPRDLRLGKVRARSIEERAEQWISLLSSRSTRALPARDLYQGDHWFVSRSLEAEGRLTGLEVKTWICSAGYGLVPLEASLIPYSATFTTENPDAVRRVGAAIGPLALDARWWELLSRWNGPAPEEPRSIKALARREPDTPILVVAAPRYVRAMATDLVAAGQSLTSPNSLCIFSAGARSLPQLASSIIPVDARLQNIVGGARFSLNARAARLAIQKALDWGLSSADLRARFEHLLGTQPEILKSGRRRMTDEEVCAYIGNAIREDDGLSHTKLLRQLRTDNGACEQKRFSRLFGQVIGECSSPESPGRSH